MKSSGKKHEGRQFFDVVERDTSRFAHQLEKRLGWEKPVNLRPPFYRRYPFLAGLLVLVILVGFYGSRLLFTRAENIDFYPTSCLGTWQNPNLAEGQPESLNTTTSIDGTDAALWQGGEGNIFCGSFVPEDFKPRGSITSVGLTFHWKVGDGEVILPTIPLSTASGTIPSPEASSTSASSTTAPEPNSSTAPTSWQKWLFPIAIAQEAQSEIVNSTVSTSSQSSDEDRVQLPPITASIEDEGSSTAATSTETFIETSTISASAPNPDEHFLKVSYSFDGKNWEEIAIVGQDNWKTFTASLSVPDWENLKNLQVKIESISTTLPTPPPVYLDGMFLEVKYAIRSFLDLGDTVSADDVILLPIGFRDATSSSTPASAKISQLLNTQYDGIIGPDSYDKRRTIWFGWCGTIQIQDIDEYVCNNASDIGIVDEGDDGLTLKMGGDSLSTTKYRTSSSSLEVVLNLVNDGWWKSSASQPIEFILEFPEKLSLSQDGLTLFLDQGQLKVRLPEEDYTLVIASSTDPVFKRAVYSFEFNSLPLQASREIGLKLWKQL